MAGVFDSLMSDDPKEQAYMALAAGLLSGRGNFNKVAGEALMGSQNVYRQAQEAKVRQQQQMLQQQMMQMQLDAAKRQQRLSGMAQQFVRPGMKPETMDNRDVGMPGEQAVPATSFDMPGYITALMGEDPVEALKLEATTKKQGPKLEEIDPTKTYGTWINGVFTPLIKGTQKPGQTPDLIETYEYAKKQGFKGSLEDWAKIKMREPQGPTPFFQPVPTTQGVMVFDSRTGRMVPAQLPSQPGVPLVKPADDPNTQGRIAEARSEGKDVGEQRALIQGKKEALSSVRDAKRLLDEGIYTGFYANVQLTGAKAIPGIDTTKAARTEEFKSMIGNVVIPRLKEFGGNDSNEELRYLQKVVGGEITMEDKALKRVVADAERKIDAGVKRLEARGQSVGAMPTQAGVRRIASDAEYNALPSGTEFIGPDGSKRRKP